MTWQQWFPICIALMNTALLGVLVPLIRSAIEAQTTRTVIAAINEHNTKGHSHPSITNAMAAHQLEDFQHHQNVTTLLLEHNKDPHAHPGSYDSTRLGEKLDKLATMLVDSGNTRDIAIAKLADSIAARDKSMTDAITSLRIAIVKLGAKQGLNVDATLG